MPSVENRLKAQRSQSVLFKAFTETRQRAGMKSIIPKLAVEGEVPAGMVPKPVDSLSVGNAIHVLEQAHSRRNTGSIAVRPVSGL